MREYIFGISRMKVIKNTIILYNISNPKRYKIIFRSKILKIKFKDHNKNKSVVNDNEFIITVPNCVGFMDQNIYNKCVMRIIIDDYIFIPYIDNKLIKRIVL